MEEEEEEEKEDAFIRVSWRPLELVFVKDLMVLACAQRSPGTAVLCVTASSTPSPYSLNFTPRVVGKSLASCLVCSFSLVAALAIVTWLLVAEAVAFVCGFPCSCSCGEKWCLLCRKGSSPTLIWYLACTLVGPMTCGRFLISSFSFSLIAPTFVLKRCSIFTGGSLLSRGCLLWRPLLQQKEATTRKTVNSMEINTM